MENSLDCSMMCTCSIGAGIGAGIGAEESCRTSSCRIAVLECHCFEWSISEMNDLEK